MYRPWANIFFCGSPVCRNTKISLWAPCWQPNLMWFPHTQKYCSCQQERSVCQTVSLEPGPGPEAPTQPNSMNPGASGWVHPWGRRLRAPWREKQSVWEGSHLGSGCLIQMALSYPTDPDTRGGLRKFPKKSFKVWAPWGLGQSGSRGVGIGLGVFKKLVCAEGWYFLIWFALSNLY